MGPLERLPEVSNLPLSHIWQVPILGQEFKYLEDHPAPFQALQGMTLVQHFIGLMEIYKYLVHHLLSQARDMLKEFGLQDGSPCTPLSYKLMQNDVELDQIHQ